MTTLNDAKIAAFMRHLVHNGDMEGVKLLAEITTETKVTTVKPEPVIYEVEDNEPEPKVITRKVRKVSKAEVVEATPKQTKMIVIKPKLDMIPVKRKVGRPKKEPVPVPTLSQHILKSDAWFAAVWPEGNAPHENLFDGLDKVSGVVAWMRDSELGNVSRGRALYAKKFLPRTAGHTQTQIDETVEYIDAIRQGISSGNPIHKFYTLKAQTGKVNRDSHLVGRMMAEQPPISVWNLFGIYLPPRRGGVETGNFMIFKTASDAGPRDNFYAKDTNTFEFRF